MITHQHVPLSSWDRFTAFYGDHNPVALVIVHPPGVHGPDVCVETRARPDTDRVHNAIERAGDWQHRVSGVARLEAKRAHLKRYRKDRHAATTAAAHV